MTAAAVVAKEGEKPSSSYSFSTDTSRPVQDGVDSHAGCTTPGDITQQAFAPRPIGTRWIPPEQPPTGPQDKRLEHRAQCFGRRAELFTWKSKTKHLSTNINENPFCNVGILFLDSLILFVPISALLHHRIQSVLRSFCGSLILLEFECKIKQNDAREGKHMQISAKIYRNDV